MVADLSVYDVTQPDPSVDKVPEDWEWMTIDRMCKAMWVDQGDGTYELQFLVSHEPGLAVLRTDLSPVSSQACPTHQPAIENLQLPNGKRGYATSDLFTPHPTKPGLWRMFVVQPPH